MVQTVTDVVSSIGDGPTPLDFNPLSRPPTLQEMVVARVRRMVITGEFRMGERIRQGPLAAALGVSPVPVREALQVLQTEGIVTYRPRRGFSVTELSTKQVEEIDLLARLLEHEAFQRGVPNLTDGDLEMMQALFEELKDLEGSDDVWRQIQIHREFHFVPIRAAGLPRLTSELWRFWEHTDHHRVLYVFKQPEKSKVALNQHAEIITACRSRQPDAVTAVQDRHRDYALVNILENVRN